MVSDGSTDETVDIARSMAGVRVLALPKNRGKVAALNAAVPELRRRDYRVFRRFRHARARFRRRLVENFADPSVGAASGRYTVVKPNDVNIGASEDLLLEVRGVYQDPGVAAGVHTGRSRASARHPQGAVSLPAR